MTQFDVSSLRLTARRLLLSRRRTLPVTCASVLVCAAACSSTSPDTSPDTTTATTSETATTSTTTGTGTTTGTEPELIIVAPADGATVGPLDDCDEDTEGLQILVQATSNLGDDDSAVATVFAGDDVEEAMEVTQDGDGLLMSLCTDLSVIGEVAGLEIIVSLVDDDNDIDLTTSVTVDIDITAPTEPITDLSFEPSVDQRRTGTGTFRFTAVADTDGTALESYSLRCAEEDIDEEADWFNAQSFEVEVSPQETGTAEEIVISGFRPEETLKCLLRGRDRAGSLTPLPTPANPGDQVAIDVVVSYAQHTIAIPTTFGEVRQATGIGDINGDGLDDFIATAQNGAIIYFGNETASELTEPDVSFENLNDTSGADGVRAAALGDLNGDGVNDFGLIELERAHIILGRAASDSPWPETPINMEVEECPAISAVCIDQDADFNFALGTIAPAGDFDNDGTPDVALGLPAAAATEGRMVVLRGGDALLGGDRIITPPGGANPMNGFVLNVATDGFLGAQVDSVLDLNGDGFDDLVVTAVSTAGEGGQAAEVLGLEYTAGTGLQEIPEANFRTFARGGLNGFGSRMVTLNDFDGDGAIDVAVGSSSPDSGFVEVHLQQGGTFVNDETRFFTIVNDAPNAERDFFGFYLAQGVNPNTAAADDLLGDGRSALLIGARARGTAAGNRSGDVSVFYGGPPEGDLTRSDAVFTVDPTTGPAVQERFGGLVGDVNQDGFPDFVVADNVLSGGSRNLLLFF